MKNAPKGNKPRLLSTFDYFIAKHIARWERSLVKGQSMHRLWGEINGWGTVHTLLMGRDHWLKDSSCIAHGEKLMVGGQSTYHPSGEING